MRDTRRSRPIIFGLIAYLAIVAASCQAPPDRIAYTSIDSAVDAVQTAMKAFNDGYQAGKFTNQDRDKVLAAYTKFQATARSAALLAQDATQKDKQTRLVSDAALEIIGLIRLYTGGA